MPFIIEQNSLPDLVSQDTFYLNVLLTIFPPPSTATARRFRGKLFIDAVEIPFKSATWNIQANSSSGNLQIELARLSDRTAFTRTALIKLQAEEFISGVWTIVKTYCDGAILSTSDYAIQNNDTIPNDTFNVTVLSVMQQKLNLTPEQIVVLYDPGKTTINEEDLELVPNIDGTEGTATITPIADMNLGDLFQFIADTYGLAGYKTNINFEPWALSRVDFPPAEPYWNTVAGIIGNHNPSVFISADNFLIIRDGTLTDFVTARQMTINNFAGFKINKTIDRFKGCHLTRQLRSPNWDYNVLRQEIENQWFGGVNGSFPMTTVITWHLDFFKTDFPNTPVFSQIFSVRQLEYETASDLISATAERFAFQFNQSGIRLIRNEMKEWGFANVPASWVTLNGFLPGPNTEFGGAFEGSEGLYTDTNIQTFSEAFVLLRAEQTLYTHFPFPGERETVFVGQTDTEQRGLVMRDTQNKQLDQDFDQPLVKAQESGNLATGQDAYWGTTDRRRESQRPERPRNVNIRTRRHSALNSTKGLIAEDYLDRRKGDIGDSDIQAETKPIYITVNGDPTASLWRQVNGGEAPLVILQPLCHRLNKLQDFPGGIDAQLPTYDPTIEIGQAIDASVDGRTTASLGIFEIIGYTDILRHVDEGGFQTSIQARQIG